MVRPACAAAAAGEGDVDADASASSSATPSGTRKQRLVFLGTPEVAAAALDAICDAAAAPDAEFEVHAVVSQPGRPRGRGRQKGGPPPPSPVAELAGARGVPDARILCPVKASEETFLEALRAMEPDLMVTAAYGNFLPRAFLDIPRLGTLNIHPSLLPQYRGAAPVQRALQDGAATTGVSVAYTVLAMDAGPVLRREERVLTGDEKHPQLLAELFERGARLLLEALPRVWDGTDDIHRGATPQEHLGEVIHAPKVSPDEAWLDFTDVGVDARTHHNKVRGFAGWPGTRARFRVRRASARGDGEGDGIEDGSEVVVKIITTRVGETGDGGEAAERTDLPAVQLGKDCMRVPCAGGGWLEVTELQPPGKKAMRAGDYANGLKGSVVTVAPLE